MSDPPGTNPIGTHPIGSDPTGTGPTQSGTTGSYPKYAQTRPGHAEPVIEVLEHAWPVRLTHWLMAASILLMIGSGWRIYNASPIFPFRFPDAFTLGGDVNVALTWHNDPVWLVMVLLPLIFVAVWVEVTPRYGRLAIFYINALLIMVEPTNPQQYDFAQGLNTLVALAAAYAFVSIVFIAIGAPKSGRKRIDELLGRMCRHLGMTQKISCATRDQQLAWETGMYDGMQQLQAESQNCRDRALAVELLLAGRRFFASSSANHVIQNRFVGTLS